MKSPAALTGVRGIDVVARSSAFRPMPQTRDSRSIGKALNADYLVQGTTRLVGDRVRITAWVTRADDGRQLWSDNYYAELPNIFDLEEDIAEKVTAALQVPTGFAERRNAGAQPHARIWRPIRISCAQRWSLRARGQKPLADAAVLLERAITRAPNYAPALALLGYDYALSPLFERSLRSGMPEEERKVSDKLVPRAAQLALLATQLDPNGADGFVALGYANMVQRRMLCR